MMEFFAFTEPQLEQVAAWNEDTEYKISPRLADNQSSPWYGRHVVPVRVVQGAYEEYWADKLEGVERFTAEPDTLFAPPPEE